jgi:hypothetical protein
MAKAPAPFFFRGGAGAMAVSGQCPPAALVIVPATAGLESKASALDGQDQG